MKESRKVGEKLYKNLVSVAFPGDSVVKNLPVNAGDTGLNPDPEESHTAQSN